MAIILSFVGSQDPFAKTETEGSIVTLAKHLLQLPCQIKRVVLLYTSGTAQNAADTAEWLSSELVMAPEAIEQIALDEALSDDPINPLLAVQAARQAVERAKQQQNRDDVLVLNASSGTPAMKTAWSILQAAGYVPNSQIWQVRNPKEVRAGQERVFSANVDFLKREFDLKIAAQQIQDYNYRGALITLGSNGRLTDDVAALLHYGDHRMARDFDRAFSRLDAVKGRVDPRWIQEISQLRQKQKKAQIQEAYFHALIRLKNGKYADFLIELFGLQENLLQWLVQEQTGLALSGDRSLAASMWEQIKQVDQGRLFQHLQNYRLPRGDKLRLEEAVSRYVMLAILDYCPALTPVRPKIDYLNEYCNLRNRSVHEFVGVSEIQDEAKLLATLQELMSQTVRISSHNPFDQLNQQLCDWLLVL